MKSISLAELHQLREVSDVEAKLAAGRLSRSELPLSFFESYSAMANTDGGVVLLGVRKRGNGFDVIGVPDVERMRRALWDGLNNCERVSANVLSDASIELLEIEGKNVISVRVPRATRQQRPVFIDNKPFGRTFMRKDGGDYRCPDDLVARLLADRESRDSRILHQHDFDDLDAASLSRYRNLFTSKNPAPHPSPILNLVDDRVFLDYITSSRHQPEAGLRAAGLLMFGRYPKIREVFPFFMLDYQERPEGSADGRWVDRVTPDGTWSGNLFDFYQIVIQRLVRDSFPLTGDTRVDESPVHEALREALVNTLVHADYSGRASVLVVKRPDMYAFRNPGRMPLPVDLAIQGGRSDCRNRVLQELFRLVGLGEPAGSGLGKISSIWHKQHWRPPELEERIFPFEQTLCLLRTVSLLPPEAMAEMGRRFGAAFGPLPDVQKLALTTVAVEGKVTHRRLRDLTSADPRDVTLALASLAQRRMLKSSGDQMATSYFFPDKPPCDEPGLAFLGESAVQHVALTGDAALVAGPVASSYKEAGPYSEHNRTVSAHSGSAQRPVDGGPYETIASAGLALIFASIDDEELRTLAALAEECDRVIDHSIRAPPSIKTNDGTAVPAPLYAKYISVYETRLHDGDLGWLLDDLHGLRDAAHPVPEMLRRIADGESKRDWSERRNIMTYVLRSQLWWAPRIEGKLVTSESLSRAQAELRILLDALIAFHWSYAADKVDLRERMDSWVASVSMTTKVNYYDSLDPNSGFLFARQNEDDLWATIIGSLFRLLPNLGPRGVKRCLHCGWYFHPAMWLKSRTTRVKYCTSFCKMTDGNLRRVK